MIPTTAENMFMITVTHVDDTQWFSRGPYVYFWGTLADEITCQQLETCISTLEPVFKITPPPRHFGALLNQICCAYINCKWIRVKVVDVDLSAAGWLKVLCIDTGVTTLTEVDCIRTLDIPGSSEASHLGRTGPLAFKFILADVVVPNGEWSDRTMSFLKAAVVNHSWKAQIIGSVESFQTFRLFGMEFNLLATALIENQLAIEGFTYKEALASSKQLKATHQMFIQAASTVATNSTVRPISSHQKTYVAGDLPVSGRHEVVVTNCSTGPVKFTMQLKKASRELAFLQQILDTADLRPLEQMPKCGMCCVVAHSETRYRGLVTLADAATKTVHVLHVDTGRQQLLNWTSLLQIPDELISIRLCGYRVSLLGAEELAKLSRMNDIFCSLVTLIGPLYCEVVVNDVPPRVHLFLPSGRNLTEVLVSIQSCVSAAPKGSLGFDTNVDVPHETVVRVEIPEPEVDDVERLYVMYSGKIGCFFGQLEKLPGSELDDMFEELQMKYQNASRPLLYSDVQSHLGDVGVIKRVEENRYYRVRIDQEISNDVQVSLIDYGSQIVVPRRDILAPIETLSKRFVQPAFGINCALLDVPITMDKISWDKALLDKSVQVKIEKPSKEGVYCVRFTDDAVNQEIRCLFQQKRTEGVVPPPKITDDNQRKIKEVTPLDRSPSLGEISPANDCRKRGDGKVETTKHPLQLYRHPNSGTTNESGTRLVQEVLRAPRGPPVTRPGALGPIGFQRAPPAQAPKSAPSVSLQQPPQVEEKRVSIPSSRDPPIALKTRPSYQPQSALTGNKKIQVVYVNDSNSFYCQLVESMPTVEKLMEQIASAVNDESKPVLVDPQVGVACFAKYAEDDGWYRGQISRVANNVVEVFFVDYGNRQETPLSQLREMNEEFARLSPQAYHCRLVGTNPVRSYSVDDAERFEADVLSKYLEADFSGQDEGGKYLVTLKFPVEAVRKPSTLVVPTPTSIYTLLDRISQPVKMARFCSLEKFFLKPADVTDKETELRRLGDFYRSLSPDELIETNAKEGLPCVVRCTGDQQFYRALITAVVDGQSVQVLFVDNGNEQLIPLSEVKRIHPRFLTQPQLVWRCKLRGIDTTNLPTCDIQPRINDSLLSGKEMTVIFNDVDTDGSFPVDITHPDVGDVATYLRGPNTAQFNPPDVLAHSMTPAYAPGETISSLAYVSYVKSVTEFWIHADPDLVDTVKDRIDALDLESESAKMMDLPVRPGMPCLAFFDGDERYYRAEVVEAVDVDSILVFYVDYGNSSRVRAKDLRVIPADFSKQPPPQARKCALNGAGTLSAKMDDVFEARVLDSSFKVQCVRMVGDVPHVRLVDADGADVLESIASGQLAREITPAEQVGDVVMPACPSAKAEVDLEMNVQPSQPAPEATEECAPPPPSPVRDTIESSACERNIPDVVEEAADRPADAAGSKTLEVYVSHCESPSRFWIQKKADEHFVTLIQTALEEAEASELLQKVEQPAVGQLYAIMHPVYASLFRARVVSLNQPKEADVYFVDYGDSHAVQSDKIFTLPSQIMTMPDMAVCCSLSVCQCTLDAAKRFSGICDNPDVVFHAVLGDEVGGTRCIEALFLDNVDVKELISGPEETSPDHLPTASLGAQRGASSVETEDAISPALDGSCLGETSQQALDDQESLVQPAASTISTDVEECPKTLETIKEEPADVELDRAPTLERDYSPGQIISTSAAVSHVASCKEVWLQTDPAAVDVLVESIGNYVAHSQSSQLSNPTVGTLCLVCYSFDGLWYRGCIKALDGDQATIEYVDYGNSETVSLDKMKPLPSQLAEQPPMAVKFVLEGTRESSELYRQLQDSLISGYASVEVVDKASGDVVVRLLDQDGNNLNKKLGLFGDDDAILQSAPSTSLGQGYDTERNDSGMLESELKEDWRGSEADACQLAVNHESEGHELTLEALSEMGVTTSMEVNPAEDLMVFNDDSLSSVPSVAKHLEPLRACEDLLSVAFEGSCVTGTDVPIDIVNSLAAKEECQPEICQLGIPFTMEQFGDDSIQEPSPMEDSGALSCTVELDVSTTDEPTPTASIDADHGCELATIETSISSTSAPPQKLAADVTNDTNDGEWKTQTEMESSCTVELACTSRVEPPGQETADSCQMDVQKINREELKPEEMPHPGFHLTISCLSLVPDDAIEISDNYSRSENCDCVQTVSSASGVDEIVAWKTEKPSEVQDALSSGQVVDVSPSSQIAPDVFAEEEEEEEKLMASTDVTEGSVAENVLDSIHLTVALSSTPESDIPAIMADMQLKNVKEVI